MQKTVIQVLTHKVCNLQTTDKDNFWGLGDIIRGTVKLYHLSKIMGFRFIVDIQLHPISQFLQIQQHEYSDLIQQNKDNIEFVFPNTVEKHILSSKKEVIYFLTNDLFAGDVTQDCKDFIKPLFSPNEEFQQYIDAKLYEIPNIHYNILHVRTGDGEMINSQIPHSILKMIDYISPFIEENYIIISDSYLLKQLINKKRALTNLPPIFYFDTKPVHMGYNKDTDGLRDTLFEYFLLTKSQKIKTFSVYDWVSGFASWASRIYDIPLTNIKTF